VDITRASEESSSVHLIQKAFVVAIPEEGGGRPRVEPGVGDRGCLA